MIDITGVDLRAFTKKVYELSAPAGRGLLHYVPGGLTDEEVDQLLKSTSPAAVLSLDYVKGRGCKMTVWKDGGGKLIISNPWFDHTAEEDFA